MYKSLKDLEREKSNKKTFIRDKNGTRTSQVAIYSTISLTKSKRKYILHSKPLKNLKELQSQDFRLFFNLLFYGHH